MDQTASIAVVASVSVYSLHRTLSTPKTTFFFPPLLIIPFLSHLSANRYLPFAAVYGLTLLALSLLYRGFGHPLNRYPGPLVARFTGLWMVGGIWSGDRAKFTKELHEKYGDYVRIAPEELSIRDGSAMPTIYGSPGWQKSELYTIVSILKGSVSSVQDERDGKEHARRRKTWDVAFTKPALARYQNVVWNSVDAMCDAILRRAKGSQGSVDLRREMMYFTWTLMYKIGYGGHGHDMVEVGPSDAWESMFHAMEAMVRMTMTLSAAIWLTPFIGKLPPDPNVANFVEVAKDQHRRRVADQTMAGDVYEALLSPLQEPGLSVTEKEKLEAEAEADSMLLVIAGADTTSSAMTWLWYYLLSEPGKVTYMELRKEVDLAFEEEHEIDSAELARRAPLLDYVINEVLRLKPPLPAGPLERQAPSTGAVIGDSQRYIPPGTKVSIPQIALSYDPKLYDEPDKFKPQRWANSDGNRAASGYAPFSYGPYSCVGKQVALQEMRHVTATLLRRFEISFAPDFDSEQFGQKASKDFFTASVVRPMPVIIEERQRG